MRPPLRWVVLGNPENRRISLFQQALASRGLPAAEVISYFGLLRGRESLESNPERAIVRIESPGENFEVEKLFLAAGVEAAEEEGVPCISRGCLQSLCEDRGRILFPRQWYLGLMAAYSNWFGNSSKHAEWTMTTSVNNLRVTFDKVLCHKVCGDAGLPIPESIGPVTDWDSLVERMSDLGLQRVFIKLANGSSASGVAALYLRDNSVELITSVELVRTEGNILLYNSLRIHRYTSFDDTRDVINALMPHRVHVEEWLPKAAVDRRVCDLRVVVVAGEPKQMVVRTSRTPLTNLHLGNRRGDLEQVLAKIPGMELESLKQTCQLCSAVFSDSLHLGLDILFTPGFRRHYLLEVNAFGDLLPGVMHQGCNTYESEIDSICRRYSAD